MVDQNHKSTGNQSGDVLSALMDGEIDELELRRLLRDLDSDASAAEPKAEHLRETWQRYHIIRAAIRNDEMPQANLDVANSVSRLLSAEPALGAIADNSVDDSAGIRASVSRQTGQSQAIARKPIVGLAVAASVAAIVLVGGQNLLRSGQSPLEEAAFAATDNTAQAPVVARGAGLQVATRVAEPPRNRQHTSFAQAQPVVVIDQAPAQLEAARNAMLQSRLQGYMRLHAEHAALNSAQALQPYTRVNYTNEQ